MATTTMLVLSITVQKQPEHHLSSVLTLPFLKRLYHHGTVLLSSVAIPQTPFNKAWMIGTIMPCKVLILMYAHCSDFVTWAEKFSATFSDNSDITKYQWQPWKSPILFVTVQTAHHRLLIKYVYNRWGTRTFFLEHNLVHRIST